MSTSTDDGRVNSSFDVLIRSIKINFKLILYVFAFEAFSVGNNVSCSQARNIEVNVAFSALSDRRCRVRLCVIKRLNRFVRNNSLRTIVLTEQQQKNEFDSRTRPFTM